MGAVLIVDDSPADRALFRTILSRAGYSVHEESRGGDAVSRAREVRPHAIVLDVNLPDMDGHSVCRALKTESETAVIPVLMLTVRDNDADVLAGLEAGADDYVAKDSDPAIVLARIRRLIQFRQLASIAVLNEQLVQVGRLLAGIVHEIRGPLSVIRGSAELIRLQLRPDDTFHQWVDPILRGAELLQVRLEHLMATVRSGPCVLDLVEVGPLVRESTELFLKGTDPRGLKITIEAILDEKVPYVRADAGRLIQVLLALLGNAHEAIIGANQGDRVIVRTYTSTKDGHEGVCIEVSDNGPGIPELYLGRIFEPFFTTKESGSGYGLYLASELLKEQQGRLNVSNVADGGACFTVWLPEGNSPTSSGTTRS
ncbi:MAG: response regulator [Isosphaeraceae bacterium]